MTNTILVVDDEKDIVDSIERQLRKDYKILKATTGIEALRLLQKEKVKVIISDQRMPEITGVQLFERAQKIQPDAIRMLLTGYTDVASVISAVNNGQIYRYITKPWDPSDLEITIKKAIETYDLRVELKNQNEKLETALGELQTLDKAKSHFMLLIGHELKTPLTTISSFCDLLSEEKLSSDSQKYAQRISQGVERLQEIIFDVLDVMSAEMGQIKIKEATHQIKEVIDSVVTSLEADAMKKEISFLLEGAHLKASYDTQIIYKIVKKILHNAIKFGDVNSEITITATENEGKLNLAIENIGPPISQNKINDLLKPFSIDENIMHHSKGLGLGLAVSQTLLKSLGSSLHIESKESKTRVAFVVGTLKK